MTGRLPNATRAARPWVIDRIAPDFRLLDVWELPTAGGPDDFDDLLSVMASVDPLDGSLLSRFLFAVRLQLGRWLHWDDPAEHPPIPGTDARTLRDRLPEDLRDSGQHFVLADELQHIAGGFRPLYRTRDEAAAELANTTVHGVLHLAWVPRGDGQFAGQMAVYVKPRGRMGALYMAFISPFRHVVVYPSLLRQIGRAWDARVATAP